MGTGRQPGAHTASCGFPNLLPDRVPPSASSLGRSCALPLDGCRNVECGDSLCHLVDTGAQ